METQLQQADRKHRPANPGGIPRLGLPGLADVLSDAYHKGHENFYETQLDFDTIEGVVEDVAEALPLLERLAIQASELKLPDFS